VPYDLVAAIEHANSVLSWAENLAEDEIPPSWMWPFSAELEAWFAKVDEKRKARHGGSGSTGSSSGSEDMVQNEYAKGWG
jgi:hypothetical protein